MISEHSAHLTPLSVDFRTWLWRYTYLLLLILMLWHRQAIFESKGDMLSSAAESRIRTRDPRHLFASRLNARWQTDWAIEDQAKKLELDSPSLWSASIQPTWPHCQLTFAYNYQCHKKRWLYYQITVAQRRMVHFGTPRVGPIHTPDIVPFDEGLISISAMKSHP